jgi:hypothetical protein
VGVIARRNVVEVILVAERFQVHAQQPQRLAVEHHGQVGAATTPVGW